MRHLKVSIRIPERHAEEIYATLCDFERFPQHSKEVRSVIIDRSNDGQILSSWETSFRGGVLRWIERDFFDPMERSIRFEQVEGDIEHFSGRWSVENRPEGGARVQVRFPLASASSEGE